MYNLTPRLLSRIFIELTNVRAANLKLLLLIPLDRGCAQHCTSGKYSTREEFFLRCLTLAINKRKEPWRMMFRKSDLLLINYLIFALVTTSLGYTCIAADQSRHWPLMGPMRLHLFASFLFCRDKRYFCKGSFPFRFPRENISSFFLSFFFLGFKNLVCSLLLLHYLQVIKLGEISN